MKKTKFNIITFLILILITVISISISPLSNLEKDIETHNANYETYLYGYADDYDGIDESKIDFTIGRPYFDGASPFEWNLNTEINSKQNTRGIGLNYSLEEQERATFFAEDINDLLGYEYLTNDVREGIYDNFNYAFFLGYDSTVDYSTSQFYTSWIDGDFNTLKVKPISQQDAFEYYIENNIEWTGSGFRAVPSELFIGILTEPDSDYTGFKMDNSSYNMNIVLDYNKIFSSTWLTGRFEKWFLDNVKVSTNGHILSGRNLAEEIMYEWIEFVETYFTGIFAEMYYTDGAPSELNYAYINIYDYYGSDVTKNEYIPVVPFAMYWTPSDYWFMMTKSKTQSILMFRVDDSYYTDNWFDVEVMRPVDPDGDANGGLYWWVWLLIIGILILLALLIYLVILKYTKNKNESN